MRRALNITVVLLGLLVLLSSCKKKQTHIPPPQAQAPTITNIPQPEQAEPLPPPPEPAAKIVPPAPPPKPKPQKKAAKKTAPKAEPNKKTVIPSVSNPEPAPQLSAGLPEDQVLRQRQNTLQLLAAADTNLQHLNRSLSPEEESMLQQIRAYMQQSRSAASDGDTERAYNLALKARLLSDELVKR